MRVDWIPEVLRAAGLEVYVMPGAFGRGRELKAIYLLVAHHTATSTRWQDGHVAALLRDGHAKLAGPLAQLGLERDGTFVFVTDGHANHNGYGDYGNLTLAIEAYNSGLGEPWPPAQMYAYIRGSAAILLHLGWTAARVRAHKETDEDRKIDPTGIDMNWFREQVAEQMEELTMPNLDEIRRVVREEIDASNDRQNHWIRAEIGKAVTSIKRNAAILRNGLATLARKIAAKLGITDV